jgi:hypothetical protein
MTPGTPGVPTVRNTSCNVTRAPEALIIKYKALGSGAPYPGPSTVRSCLVSEDLSDSKPFILLPGIFGHLRSQCLLLGIIAHHLANSFLGTTVPDILPANFIPASSTPARNTFITEREGQQLIIGTISTTNSSTDLYLPGFSLLDFNTVQML